MGANNPQQQHFNPEMLLKNFCNESGQLWVNRGGRVFPSKPNNIFKQKDLYTMFNIDYAVSANNYEEFLDSITKDYECEEGLGTIESHAEPAIQRIVEHVRLGRHPQLSSGQRKAMQEFLIAMARRNPESQRRVGMFDGPRDVFYEVTKAKADSDGFPLGEREALYNNPQVIQLKHIVGQNSRARFSAGQHSILKTETDKFCAETGLGIAAIQIPCKSFVIGSHGIALVESEDGSIVGWLPISSDVAICATAYPSKDWLLLIDEYNNSQLIDQINEASAKNSQMIAGRSETLVRSLNPRPVAG